VFSEDNSWITSKNRSIDEGVSCSRISLALARRLGGRLTGFSKASSVAGRFKDFVALSWVSARAAHRQGSKNLRVCIFGQLLRVRNDLIGNKAIPPVIVNSCNDGPITGVTVLNRAHQPIAFLAPHARSSPNITASFRMTLCGSFRVDGTSDLTIDARGIGWSDVSDGGT